MDSADSRVAEEQILLRTSLDISTPCAAGASAQLFACAPQDGFVAYYLAEVSRLGKPVPSAYVDPDTLDVLNERLRSHCRMRWSSAPGEKTLRNLVAEVRGREDSDEDQDAREECTGRKEHGQPSHPEKALPAHPTLVLSQRFRQAGRADDQKDPGPKADAGQQEQKAETDQKDPAADRVIVSAFHGAEPPLMVPESVSALSTRRPQMLLRSAQQGEHTHLGSSGKPIRNKEIRER